MANKKKPVKNKKAPKKVALKIEDKVIAESQGPIELDVAETAKPTKGFSEALKKVKKDYTQCGEQEIILTLVEAHKPPMYAVEIGAMDGVHLSNTKALEEIGFERLLIDCDKHKGVVQEFITAENINEVLKANNCPDEIGVISIDINGNDYYVWEALEFDAKIVCIEFNPGVHGSKTIEYDPNFKFEDTRYFGATWEAMRKLGKKKGYGLVHTTPLNMIFVKGEKDICKTYNSGKTSGWPMDVKKRKWVNV